MQNLIALITDFGTKDNYVATMKGFILSQNPDAKIIDITHDIQPQNIKEAAYILLSSFDYFPQGTIFVCVVDPGVGSERKAIAARIGEKYYIGPDNGIVSYIMENYGVEEAYCITNSRIIRQDISNTFHGRDVFAPAAAALSKGVFLNEFGDMLSQDLIVRLSSIRSKLGRDGLRYGEIIYIDRFGNIITSLKSDILGVKENEIYGRAEYMIISVGSLQVNGLKKTFSDVHAGDVLAYIGSSGYIEIGKRNGSAAEETGAVIGMEVKAEILK